MVTGQDGGGRDLGAARCRAWRWGRWLGRFEPPRALRALAWGLMLGALASAAAARGPATDGAARAAVEALRAQEIKACAPGEIQTWPDGRDRPARTQPLQLAYRHSGAPPWLAEAQVRQALQRSVLAWSGCGLGLSVVAVAPEGQPPPGVALVHWHEPDSAGTFGLANPARRTLSLGRGAFGLLRDRNPAYPAEQVLQMVLSHELGHLLGLMAHSRRCVDVMSYYTDGRGGTCSTRDGGDHRRLPEYRATLPTACDIARCRAANGL